ncbi:MAG: type II toxin-antitoxin system prevent-host-death family antitoxin [Rhodomicrobium sp.]
MTTRISAQEFHRSIGDVSKRARREPVVITNQGDDDLVLLSAAEYARLQRSERRVHLTSEFPDDLLELVKQSQVDPSHAHLDDELTGWKPSLIRQKRPSQKRSF